MNPSELLDLLARSLATADDDRPLPVRLCQACVDVLDALGGTLTVVVLPGDSLVVGTSEVFAELDSLQEVLGEGPVEQALREDRVVTMRLQEAPNQFPVFAQQAERAIGAPLTVYAVPMRVGVRTVGVLSLYLTAAEIPRSTEDLQFLADAVGISLLGDLKALDWSQKARIHQATGMVTAQLRISPEDALAVLRAHAFARSTDLQAVAEDVLAQRMAFSHDVDRDAADGTEGTEET